MSVIVLLDTTILMNVWNVPGFNQHRGDVFSKFSTLIDQGAHLFIPMAAIFEAGNHIAQLSDGQMRRSVAQRFSKDVMAALKGNAPWKAIRKYALDGLEDWVSKFPDEAMAGLGMGDLSIKMEWEALSAQFPMSHVTVWTLDGDLAGLDRVPAGSQ
jgi:hypothetical protein